MKLDKFLGINNVADPERLRPGEMVAAEDVDIGGRGTLMARRGRTLLQAGAAHSVFKSPFGVFVVIDNDLLLFDTAGVLLRTVYNTIGYTRVWYTLLPDGRVGFSNGLVQGLASETETTMWGVPVPVDAGTGIDGGTPYMITYVRISDSLEGPPCLGTKIDMTELIIGLPTMDGYRINVYFAPYGEEMYLAGSTDTDTFSYDGRQLVLQHTGRGLGTPPTGTLLHAWNSRVLLVDGRTIWATRPLQPELCDLTQDFLQMPAEVTLVYGNGDGLFVGTIDGLYFLAGQVLADLKSSPIASGYVAKGSGVEIPLSYLNEKARPSGQLQGSLCLIDGAVHLLFGPGNVVGLTTTQYRISDVTEVHATFRVRDGVGQYLAAPA